MEAKGKASPSRSHLELDLEEETRFSAKEESILLLLLLHLLGQQANYTLRDDWQDIFIDRTPLDAGILGLLKGEPRNRFRQLLSQVGLAPRAQKSRLPAGYSILNDAYQVYSLSRGDWVHRMRSSLGLTVFSKSYCPYSQKAKVLLDSLGAVYTVYEVDLRPDSHNLQMALARLTGHATFPTILARDKVLGGNDDLHEYYRTGALEGVLHSVRAL
ncbi:related to Glutaredoxin [Ustilago bromivora]|uniref:Related to Glutaredoxin n=1 Tax=Ustilago bromivora TaxID=307758 RepID=A0A1K0HEH5_9BASI|nr:related to Glutaredoxin [Ustilago bromivora]